MKNILLALLLFSVLTVNGQKESKPASNLKVYSNPFSIELIYATTLSEKWALASGLAISKAIDYNSIEFLPLSLEYHITKKWKIFGGPKLRVSFVKDNYFSGTQSQFSVLGQLGTRYDHNKGFFGELLFEYPMSQQTHSQNNYTQPSLFVKAPLTLKIGGQF